MKLIIAALLFIHVNAALSQTSGPESRRLQPVPAATDSSQLDLSRFAASIIKSARTDYERAVRLLDWLSHNFKWLG